MTEESAIFDIEVKLFIEAVFMKYKYDFRQYSLASVKRRLSSVLIVHKIKTISALQEKVLYEPDFFNAVLQYMTISTTEMFRDPNYFKAFQEKVLPYLQSYPSIKIWVAGCSSGEEAYSFAIIFKEAGLLDRVMIYATDINPVILDKAKAGIYKLEDMKKNSLNYQQAGGQKSLSDYYTASYNAAAIDPALKKSIVFADHSLATDSVFSEMQFVSCRNVLIYFDKELQNRAINLFHDSLSMKGFLGIGSKESLKFSSQSASFEQWSANDRIYRKLK
ncbi:protein-glutamate O-methyltransferase CheR [Bacteriovorax sp. PP10]|uniref:Protein-glutamate O-methyltransferase CheR n=1 Tax=Bacteriovorax antarcticus TaxID=3088717 RepID=A0ABU5VT16_9BACT|nr:protein-glutamate O-methyltransferase CheR [Bacteriovorax sp. PP10]MEA9356196.1 protein-glutamate O-methyltransferase CheR [Bacteriovorax sp. PP10]